MRLSRIEEVAQWKDTCFAVDDVCMDVYLFILAATIQGINGAVRCCLGTYWMPASGSS